MVEMFLKRIKKIHNNAKTKLEYLREKYLYQTQAMLELFGEILVFSTKSQNYTQLIFVLVDDWYQSEEKSWSGKSPGVKAEMSDSEIMTLALVMDYLPFPGESHDGSGTSRIKFGVSSRQFIGFIRANYKQWFPTLLERSQFNRRLRRLESKLEMLRRTWVWQLGGFNEDSMQIAL
jgi:hypothetical protein